MKDIVTKINESNQGSSFEPYRYEKADWEEWLKLIKKEKFGKDIFIGNYDSDPELKLVYKINNAKKTMDHIASYNVKTQTLYCDDINLFGNVCERSQDKNF